jgi:hypothetical protein
MQPSRDIISADMDTEIESLGEFSFASQPLDDMIGSS